MIKRNITRYLTDWRNGILSGKSTRKPLILRGARQVGKTYAVEAFGRSEFEQFVQLNLEKDADRRLFDVVRSAKEYISTIELKTGSRIVPGRTLLFIDEIQNSEVALTQLRYFHEEVPNLHVIAAGSLLDVFVNKNRYEIPVGRVEYSYLHPLGFDEFLAATNKDLLLEGLLRVGPTTQISPAQHELYNKAFLEYVLIGGMPEVVAHFAAGETPLGLNRIYESLLTGLRDDIGKYASPAQAQYLRHCLENTPRSVGMQISYHHFGESAFRSREISGAFDTLELAQLVTRVFASRSLSQPLVQNRKKAPKLIFLDTGLVNYKLGQRDRLTSLSTLENVFQGQISEQVVGQTLLCLGESSEIDLHYWYRDKKGSTAEVDYLLSCEQGVVPIEVKAGSSQKIQSLYALIDERYKQAQNECPLAIKVHSGPLSQSMLVTAFGNKFRLLSVPYYLLFRIRDLLHLMS